MSSYIPVKCAHLTELPTELLEDILDVACLSSRDACVNLTSVASWTRALALSHLLSVVALDSKEALIAFHRFLCNQNRQGGRIKGTPDGCGLAGFVKNFGLFDSTVDAFSGLMELVVDVLLVCSNLSSLAVHPRVLSHLGAAEQMPRYASASCHGRPKHLHILHRNSSTHGFTNNNEAWLSLIQLSSTQTQTFPYSPFSDINHLRIVDSPPTLPLIKSVFRGLKSIEMFSASAFVAPSSSLHSGTQTPALGGPPLDDVLANEDLEGLEKVVLMFPPRALARLGGLGGLEEVQKRYWENDARYQVREVRKTEREEWMEMVEGF